MLNLIWSYKDDLCFWLWALGMGIIGGFRVEFKGGVKWDLETNENRLHRYKNKIGLE